MSLIDDVLRLSHQRIGRAIGCTVHSLTRPHDSWPPHHAAERQTDADY
jgi:hypothetical protein